MVNFFRSLLPKLNSIQYKSLILYFNNFYVGKDGPDVNDMEINPIF